MTASARPAGDPGEWLAALEQAHAAGTPGPWQHDGTMVESLEDPGLTIVDCWETPADAALIVTAVNALPRLIAAVRGVLTLCDAWDDGPNDEAVPTADLRTTIAAALSVPPAPEEKP